MIPHYVPAFTHQDWIDNQDRVQAGGDKGLNIRFHNLEQEFQTIAEQHLNPVINALSRGTGYLSLSPLLTANQPGKTGWQISDNLAQKPSDPNTGAKDVHGIMNVVLPDGAVIQSMTVWGDQQVLNPTPDNKVTVVLRMRAVTGIGGSQDIVSFTAFGKPAQPSATTVVSNNDTTYFIVAEATGFQPGDQVKLNGIQIAYQ